MTQSEFAQSLHVSYQAVSNWERGIAPPDIDNLLRIAQNCGVLVDDLLRPDMIRYLLGVDGGGTKTEFVVFTSDGTVCFQMQLSGSNPNDIGLEASVEVLRKGIHACLLKYPGISDAFLGIAGMTTGENKQWMSAKMTELFPTISMTFDSDIANIFGMESGVDIAVICGTGSVIFAQTPKERIRLGGWGYLFDEEGSAYDIGRDGIRVALAEEEGLGASSLITVFLREALDVSAIWQGIARLYKEGRPKIAELSRVVFRAYKEGDALAEEILDRNMRRLAFLLETASTRYHLKKRAISGGGLLSHQKDILLPILQKYTEIELLFCELPPVFGACRSCLQQARIAENESFYLNFQKSYGKSI